MGSTMSAITHRSMVEVVKGKSGDQTVAAVRVISRLKPKWRRSSHQKIESSSTPDSKKADSPVDEAGSA